MKRPNPQQRAQRYALRHIIVFDTDVTAGVSNAWTSGYRAGVRDATKRFDTELAAERINRNSEHQKKIDELRDILDKAMRHVPPHEAGNLALMGVLDRFRKKGS